MVEQMVTNISSSGKTKLAGFGIVYKSHPAIHALGELDELNVWLGAIREEFDLKPDPFYQTIYKAQVDIIRIKSEMQGNLEHILSAYDVTNLKADMDKLIGSIKRTKDGFLIPCWPRSINVATVVCRRAERNMVGLYQYHEKNMIKLYKEAKPLPKFALPYLNILSNYLEYLAVYMSQMMQVPIEKWTPIKEETQPVNPTEETIGLQKEEAQTFHAL